MPLKLSLKPNEKILVNGAVLENGPHRAEIVLQNKATVLRQKDIMTESAADTPAKRIYFLLQLLYISTEQREARIDKASEALSEFLRLAPSAGETIAQMSGQLAEGRVYDALQACKELIQSEATAMEHA